MSNLFLTLSVLLLTACGSGGNGGAASQASLPVNDPIPGVAAPTPTPALAPQALTYYSRTTSLGVPGGFTFFTGSCMNYGLNTYCWDDGEKRIQNLNYCSFWNIGDCTAGNKADYMAVPKVLSVNLIAEFNHTLLNYTASQVLTGVPTNVNCTDDGTTLDCGTFQIDLTQVSL